MKRLGILFGMLFAIVISAFAAQFEKTDLNYVGEYISPPQKFTVLLATTSSPVSIVEFTAPAASAETLQAGALSYLNRYVDLVAVEPSVPWMKTGRIIIVYPTSMNEALASRTDYNEQTVFRLCKNPPENFAAPISYMI